MKLTNAETQIYTALNDVPGEIVSMRDLCNILESIREPGREANSWQSGNLVAVHMRNLRKKLQEAGSSEQIECVRGVGYRLIFD